MPAGRLVKVAALLSALFLLAATVACTSSGEDDARGRPARSELERNPCVDLDRLVAHVRRGYYPYRSPDISWIPHEPNYVGTRAMPVHSGPWDYLTHVPIVVHGPGLVEGLGRVSKRASMADLAATTAHLIGFEEWPRRDGRVLSTGLVDGAPAPRLVVTVVWDGGGWNVLREHEGAWPFLERLMARSVTYTNATVGSSPSVTPPIHTTLGTGAWPSRHGVSGLRVRAQGSYVNPFGGLEPRSLELTTLADEYDLARGNAPVTGMLGSKSWHLGMIGHGALLEGADRDPVAMIDRHTAGINSNERLFSLPDIAEPEALRRFAEEIDARDAKRDSEWLGHPLDAPGEAHLTPATSLFEEYMLEKLVRAEGFGADDVPDLLYVNFKTADVAGHHFGMTSDEVREVITAQDEALGRFVAFLDEAVGREGWVLMLTADHGQTPYPEESGAWPIAGGEISADANAEFDVTDDGVDLVAKSGSAGMYVRLGELKANETSLRAIARWLAEYTVAENLTGDEGLPEDFEGRGAELLFDATLVRDKLATVSCRG